MTYLEVLRNGKIPEKRPKNVLTPYDKYMAKRVKPSPDGARKRIAFSAPQDLSATEALIKELKGGHGIIVDLSGAAPVAAQRILDFVSGAVFALDGKMERVTREKYLATPKGIDIVGGGCNEAK